MIKIIHQNTDVKNIIVFIHGFIGGERTWVKENGEMPLINPLLNDEKISKNFDIGIFEYHSHLIKIFPKIRRSLNKLWAKKKTVKNSPIEDIAKILGTSLKYKCPNYDNIILISHSMGGGSGKKVCT